MKPIIFSAPMVRAGQTRRVVKGVFDDIWVKTKHPYNTEHFIGVKNESTIEIKCPYGKPGDILWVRETFYKHRHIGMKFSDEYEALPDNLKPYYRKCSPIFMSKWASRTTLKISDVRVERLQEISEEDAIGACKANRGDDAISEGILAVASFADIWNSINQEKHSWASNPWVWVIDFERVGR